MVLCDKNGKNRMLAFATLCKKRKKYSFDSYCMAVPALGFAARLVQEPYEGEFPNLLRLSPNFSPNFL